MNPPQPGPARAAGFECEDCADPDATRDSRIVSNGRDAGWPPDGRHHQESHELGGDHRGPGIHYRLLRDERADEYYKPIVPSAAPMRGPVQEARMRYGA
jgi:hypothetical protein